MFWYSLIILIIRKCTYDNVDRLLMFFPKAEYVKDMEIHDIFCSYIAPIYKIPVFNFYGIIVLDLYVAVVDGDDDYSDMMIDMSIIYWDNLCIDCLSVESHRKITFDTEFNVLHMQLLDGREEAVRREYLEGEAYDSLLK